MLRFVSFYFLYLFYFSFVEDTLKQYLKDKNGHYHFPFSLINSSFEIKKKKIVVMCSSPPQNVKFGSFKPWSHVTVKHWDVTKRRTETRERAKGDGKMKSANKTEILKPSY